MAAVSYWQKYVHEVLVNRLGGLCLPRNCVVRITDCPDMTIDVYCGRKTTTQLQPLTLNENFAAGLPSLKEYWIFFPYFGLCCFSLLYGTALLKKKLACKLVPGSTAGKG